MKTSIVFTWNDVALKFLSFSDSFTFDSHSFLSFPFPSFRITFPFGSIMSYEVTYRSETPAQQQTNQKASAQAHKRTKLWKTKQKVQNSLKKHYKHPKAFGNGTIYSSSSLVTQMENVIKSTSKVMLHEKNKNKNAFRINWKQIDVKIGLVDIQKACFIIWLSLTNIWAKRIQSMDATTKDTFVLLPTVGLIFTTPSEFWCSILYSIE